MPWYYLVPSGFAAPEVPKENHLGEMKQKGTYLILKQAYLVLKPALKSKA